MNDPIKLKDLKRGEIFTKRPTQEPSDSQVWIRGFYCRSLKKIECTRWSDINDTQFIDPDKEVYVDFIF